VYSRPLDRQSLAAIAIEGEILFFACALDSAGAASAPDGERSGGGSKKRPRVCTCGPNRETLVEAAAGDGLAAQDVVFTFC